MQPSEIIHPKARRDEWVETGKGGFFKEQPCRVEWRWKGKKIKEGPELKVMHDRRLVPRADVGRDVRCGEDSGWDFSRYSIEFHTPRPMWEDRNGCKKR